MGQVTWRAPDALIERVQNLAVAEGASMNELITRVLSLATDSDDEDPAAVRLRSRMRAAGILATGTPGGPRPSPDELARARDAAGSGTPLSEVVASMRE